MTKVYKFGGAAVKDADGIRNLTRIVLSEKERLLVVVSAIGKTTNELEKIVASAWEGRLEESLSLLEILKVKHYKIIDELLPVSSAQLCKAETDKIFLQTDYLLRHSQDFASFNAFYDQVVSVGELLSTTIVSFAIAEREADVRLFNASRIVRTDAQFRSANVDMQATAVNVKREMSDFTRVAVIQGFIGGADGALRTTLGREGSDYSAALFANLLNADSLTIWKDVPGILNADPKRFPQAVLIPRMRYEDAIELSYSGAQVIHPKTIRPLQNKNIPLYVKPFTDKNASGSVICGQVKEALAVPVYIYRENQVLVTVRDTDFGFALEESLSKVFSAIARLHLQVSLVQNSAITITVSVTDNQQVDEFIGLLQNEGYRVTYNRQVALITVLGKITPQAIDKVIDNKDVILSQTTRNSQKFVVKNEILKQVAPSIRIVNVQHEDTTFF